MRRFFPCQPLAQIQQLELRRLLAVQVSFDPDAGLLNVMGDDSSDQIDVSLQFGVDGPGPALGMLVTVRDRGEEVFSGYFLEGQLRDVHVDGGFGNDDISIFNDDSPVNTFVSGNAGKDMIDSYIEDRATPSRIHGGEGDDMITLATGLKALEGFVVLGDGGNDTISGSRYGDVLYGDNESTSPVSIPGDDMIIGGGGNDALYGGMGDDELFGGDGNDVLTGGEGADALDGGSGIDRAVVDGFDKFANVETVVFE